MLKGYFMSWLCVMAALFTSAQTVVPVVVNVQQLANNELAHPELLRPCPGCKLVEWKMGQWLVELIAAIGSRRVIGCLTVIKHQGTANQIAVKMGNGEITFAASDEREHRIPTRLRPRHATGDFRV